MQSPPPAPVLVIEGSARDDGNTAALTASVLWHLKCGAVTRIDLSRLTIAPYNYAGRYEEDDDFLSIAALMRDARAIVLASPVYWYSMSGPMKVFFDRLTDLTDTHKAAGKALAGKRVFVIATGNSAEPPAAFEPPFADTARYFNMDYGGMLYGRGREVIEQEAAAFAARIGDAVSAAALSHGR